MTLPLLTVRSDVASYLDALIWVYTLVIFAYIVSSWIFAMGIRIPYSRYTDAVLGFLRDVTEPYLSLFRRFIPPFGAFDFSPIIAIFALRIVGGIVVSLIRG
ncbi:MAG: YggT family protein [Solirubrobacteraceae bacterium]|nr:YggT family protein [Solirubrobacteraceae bacterium]MEA2300435.1 YggT family protein [Solirubrobacteraceae bacterium]MEA2355927.1 YggT family protein [Solirubrobacteraceae bacterium]